MALASVSCTVLDAPGKLGKILTGMNRALGEIPLTVKLRTGVKEGRNTSHKLMPRIGSEWNVAAMTVSGAFDFVYLLSFFPYFLSYLRHFGRTLFPFKCSVVAFVLCPWRREQARGHQITFSFD